MTVVTHDMSIKPYWKKFLQFDHTLYDGRLLILVFLTFRQSLAQLHEVVIRLWLWFSHHHLHLADLNVAHLWVKNPQNGIYILININILIINIYISFTEIKKQNMMKMLVFTLYLKVDAKLITVNEITCNLFIKQAKCDS